MEQTVFSGGRVSVIGFRGAVPHKIGLFPAVYRYAVERKVYYAIGDELGLYRNWPCRTQTRILNLISKGVITRHRDIIRVDDHVLVLCVTKKADAMLSKVLPGWRATHVPLEVFYQSVQSRFNERQRHEASHADAPRLLKGTLRFPVCDPPALAFLLLQEEAEELALTTVIALQTVMDDCLLDNSNDESVELAEELGWIAWGLLSRRHQRARRDTMIRIVAARSLQPLREDFPELARIAMKSLELSSALEIMDLALSYLQHGAKYAPTSP